MKIIFYGDSNTYGYDPRGALGGRYPREVRWTDRLQALLGEEWTILAEGMNGRCIPRTRGEMQWLVRLVREEQADCLAVMLGTNDCLLMPQPSTEAVGERLRGMVRMLRELAPDLFGGRDASGDGRHPAAAACQLLILAPPVVEFGGPVFGERPWISPVSLTDVYRQIAEETGALYIDTAAWELPLSYDRVHLSEAGHRRMADKLAQTLLAQTGSSHRGRFQ